METLISRFIALRLPKSIFTYFKTTDEGIDTFSYHGVFVMFWDWVTDLGKLDFVRVFAINEVQPANVDLGSDVILERGGGPSLIPTPTPFPKVVGQ